MIKYKIGNLFSTSADIIAHGCNAQGVMGSGVAKEIKKRFPKAFKLYQESYQLKHLKVGKVLWSWLDNPIIANCITQEYYGNDGQLYLDYDGLKLCLEKINIIAKDKQWSVALPRIGAGLGGGDWNIIKEIIEKSFDENIRVEVYTL